MYNTFNYFHNDIFIQYIKIYLIIYYRYYILLNLMLNIYIIATFLNLLAA